MNLNDYLAACHEPPADSAEQAEADRLAAALERLERGEPAADADTGRQLSTLQHAARVFRRGTGLLADAPTDSADTLIPADAGPPAAALPDPFPGEYRLVAVLGQGAFGTVWLAEDVNLHRQVALKTLRPSGDPAAASQRLAALRNEARTLASL